METYDILSRCADRVNFVLDEYYKEHPIEQEERTCYSLDEYLDKKFDERFDERFDEKLEEIMKFVYDVVKNDENFSRP